MVFALVLTLSSNTEENMWSIVMHPRKGLGCVLMQDGKCHCFHASRQLELLWAKLPNPWFGISYGWFCYWKYGWHYLYGEPYEIFTCITRVWNMYFHGMNLNFEAKEDGLSWLRIIIVLSLYHPRNDQRGCRCYRVVNIVSRFGIGCYGVS